MTLELEEQDQRAGSARFEARDPATSGPAVFGERSKDKPGPAVFESRQSAQGAYKGPERRRSHRRSRGDRREEMRFELSKPDRRVCEGRRADDKNPKFW